MSDTSKEMRKLLKQHGYNARRVSVKHHQYSMGSTVHVTIRDPEVDAEKIKDIVDKFERVSYDERSGEILSGGNRFVEVKYSEGAKELRREPFMAAIEEALHKLKELDPSDNRTCVEFGNFLMHREYPGSVRVNILSKDADGSGSAIGSGNIDYPYTIGDIVAGNWVK